MLNDKWTLERLLGVGGMAAVYAARHRNGARAAVKVLHPDLSRHREVRERFLREGYAANRVEHPSAVKVMDDDVVASGPDAGTAYLVMELLEGESLQDRLERGPPVGEREFLVIAETVLDVLERGARARRRAPRPQAGEPLPACAPRATRTRPPRVKVLDFGLARLLDGQTITSYGLALGTPSFMSPEQAAGRIDEIDGRTDLFALAATGFRLRTGRRIHEGANAVELVGKMANFAAPKIETVRARGGRALRARHRSRARVPPRGPLRERRRDAGGRAPGDRGDGRRRADRDRDVAARVGPAAARSRVSGPAAPRPAGPPPLPVSRREATMEVSERELEPLPVLPTTQRRRRRVDPAVADAHRLRGDRDQAVDRSRHGGRAGSLHG